MHIHAHTHKHILYTRRLLWTALDALGGWRRVWTGGRERERRERGPWEGGQRPVCLMPAIPRSLLPISFTSEMKTNLGKRDVMSEARDASAILLYMYTHTHTHTHTSLTECLHTHKHTHTHTHT